MSLQRTCEAPVTVTDEPLARRFAEGAEAELRLFLQSLTGGRVPRQDEIDELVGIVGARLREHQDLYWGRREAERVLVRQLLRGEPVELLAERLGMPIDCEFHMLAVRVIAPVRSRAVGSRAVLDIVREGLDDMPGTALAAFEGIGGAVLVPFSGVASTECLDTLIFRVAAVSGMRTVAGAATASDISEIPAKYVEADEIACLAQGLGRTTGVYWIADLALQYQLVRPGSARTWLLTLLAPLAGQPHLLDALRTYFDHQHNRWKAAATLHVHRNTITYRLNRIAELTGYDPARPDHAQLFAAALTAHDLAGVI